jgi:ADP-dependent phosphofructokinase/glucokinase
MNERIIELLEIIAREVEGLSGKLDYITEKMVDEDQMNEISENLTEDIAALQTELELRRHADKVIPP